ncbi:hypothetical protein MPTK1_1g19050 [Marchantia polymorpha subsp. ruderalis]|uniref:C2H2-type domain-containing protein n=2 Tax=Marchantia polymorpha TaxID=3197 RepID=A0AAF6ARR7_MARPO|nr:hypothetical protein MARPO_0001s0243 [Marchantia polymorpha]BBM99137.1 hypothetical protein Mp_1g19050 [Marchantia polymorpha subsp. ruderalis]|eukprot:PTQ50214.1 hypothetical protein MARPO_0001s0243 [Marchantia polymorpha]
MKEGAARAVLREAWLRGHRCVELQRDGRRTIFVCTRCGTRCYSDGALVDHLQGNLHARLSAQASAPQHAAILKTGSGERSILKRGKEQDDGEAGAGVAGQDFTSPEGLAVVPHSLSPRDSQILLADASGAPEASKTPLQWIGSGELFFSLRFAGAAPLVEASWFCWRGKGKSTPEAGWQSGQAGGIVYAVVMFPYSDMIGRGGNWKPWFDMKQARSQPSETEDVMLLEKSSNDTLSSKTKLGCKALALIGAKSTSSDNLSDSGKETSLEVEQQNSSAAAKDSTGRVVRRWKRKKPRLLERLCFICHQRMTAGKDVAALLNLQTKQMVCGSRNKRGVFHVYHSSCLIDWISICEVKTFSGALDHRIDRTRKLLKSRRAIIEQTLKRGTIQDDGSNPFVDGAVFCPECQGTGLKVRGAQLERPRYRLAQVFDWILELIQARKAWSENPRSEETSHSGLLFRDELKGAVQSRGLVHYYSGCAELLAGNASDK